MPSKPENTPEPILITRTQLPRILNISQRAVDRLRASGAFSPTPIWLGGRVLYRLQDIQDWIAAGESGHLLSREEWARIKAKDPPNGVKTNAEA